MSGYQSPAQEATSARRLLWAAKNVARGVLWRTLEKTYLDLPLAAVRRASAVVFYYRAVGGSDLPLSADNVIAPEKFRCQMEYLRRHRNVISIEECLSHIDRHGRPPARCAVLTFDDGFACCRDYAAPILHELGLPATFFVIAGFTEAAEPKWDDFLRLVCDPFDKWVIRQPAHRIRAEIERVRTEGDPGRIAAAERALRAAMLTWQQMRELIAMGFSIGSHGFEHWYLSSQDEGVQAREIVDSKRILERELGQEIRYFAVPFSYPGSFDATSMRLMQEAGYAGAFGGHRGYLDGRSERFAMPRIVVHDGTSESRFRVAVSGCLV